MLRAVLGKEGRPDNHKQIRRLYRAEGLAVRRRRRKGVSVARVPIVPTTKPNERWDMDFMRGTLQGNRAFRMLNILDTYTRECLAMKVDVSLGGDRVMRVLERLGDERALPQTIVVDNGPEFHSKALDAWAQTRGVQLQSIRPGTLEA